MAKPKKPKQGDPFDRTRTRLDRTVIALPLLDKIEALKAEGSDEQIDVIIDANLLYPAGRDGARTAIMREIRAKVDDPDALDTPKNEISAQYIFARLRPSEIETLVRDDLQRSEGVEAASDAERPAPARAIYKVWLDHEVGGLTNKSISTVKADAASNAFGAYGDDIVWAVLDSGIDATHPHFQKHGTLNVTMPLRHRDFSGAPRPAGVDDSANAQRDVNGHGTHVAGIIAGEVDTVADKRTILAQYKRFLEDGRTDLDKDDKGIRAIRGMAPRAKLLSLKVLDDDGKGRASNLIVALEYIQTLNAHGRHLLVHGVNLSVGYDFQPEWFACGQSPLCIEVNRLVSAGVVVVVAAGNTGYGYNQVAASGPNAAGLDITINDPGNAEHAITVGSTHRDMPHVYGVSFFSSKGPTGDGRMKPDLVAPGEKIISCQSRQSDGGQGRPDNIAAYIEDSGTSMAAPHVSGVIASFLSIRREFIGKPLRVKEIFLDSATDLRRAVYFQGRGLVDLMRAIQSV